MLRRAVQLLVTGLASATCSGCFPATDKPNLVLIIVDTLRADHLGSYGHSDSASPELDALAAAGVRFDQAFVQSTWTRPSIGSMITSHYPRTLGIYKEEDQILPASFTTLAEALQEHGYATFGITANPTINSYFNFDQGFDTYVDSETIFEFMVRDDSQEQRGKDAWLPRARDVFDRTLREIRSDTRGPWFLQLDIMEVHEFWDENVEYGSPYDTLYADRPLRLRRYLQAIRLVSAEIDRFVRTLQDEPGWENTVFVITSDHGETIDDHPSLANPKWHGWLVYETQSRVPLIVLGTGRSSWKGRVIDRPVRLVDLMPTLLELAGARPPEGIVGRSLVPFLEDESAAVELPDMFVVETELRDADKIAVYSFEDGFKYVANRDGHRGTHPAELQRLGGLEDGGATDELPSHRDLGSRLQKRLRVWEADHPRADPTTAEERPPDALLDQLRSLGYLD